MTHKENLAPVDFGVDKNKSIRDQINQLEQQMLQATDQVAIEPVHYFARGLYAREITIPKGTCLTGKIHKYTHINIISKGDISVLTENGIERIQAPYTIVSQPGTKRVGYAHEDTVWTTLHASSKTDMVELEEELIIKSFDELPVEDKKLIGER